MSLFKIILYLLLATTTVQIIRQIINIIKLKYSSIKCIEHNEIIKYSEKTKNLLLIGDNSILGYGLFDCKNNINQQLSNLLKINVYTYGKSDIRSRNFYDFIKSKWFDINKVEYDYIIVSIGNNDLFSVQFDIDSKYYDRIIELLKILNKNIFILSPRDFYNDQLYVFPIDYYMKYRNNILFDKLQTVAHNNGVTFIDVRKESLYHCKEGQYCRINNSINLDENGYYIYAKAIEKIINENINK